MFWAVGLFLLVFIHVLTFGISEMLIDDLTTTCWLLVRHKSVIVEITRRANKEKIANYRKSPAFVVAMGNVLEYGNVTRWLTLSM